MSAEWGLLPAGIDETDLVIILGILYGVRELKQKEELIDN
jgi:hypothetical protein